MAPMQGKRDYAESAGKANEQADSVVGGNVRTTRTLREVSIGAARRAP